MIKSRRINAWQFGAGFAFTASLLVAGSAVAQEDDIDFLLEDDADSDVVVSDEAATDADVEEAPKAAEPVRTRRVIEEVVVTAQKREQMLEDIPLSMTAMSGDALEAMGAEGLSDIAKATPSLSVIESAPGVQNLQIRGISTNFGKATVGYQLDNVSLTSNALYQTDAPTYDLASVEVLRGPQGTLYGEGSMGGTIKLVTQKPRYEEWELTTQTGYNVTADGGPSAELDAAANIPLTSNSALRAVVSFDDIGGFIDYKFLAEENVNEAKRANGRIAWGWNPADEWEVQTLVMRSDTSAGAANAADENYERDDRSESDVQDKGLMYSIDVNWAPEWGDITFANTLFDRKLLFQTDARETIAALAATGFDPIDDATLDNVDAAPNVSNITNKTFASELRFVTTPSDSTFLTAGLYYRRADETLHSTITIETPSQADEPFQDLSQRVDTQQQSVFGQFEWDAFEWLNLAVGARYFIEDVDFVNEGFTSFTASVDAENNEKFSNFSKRVVASFRAPAGLFDWVDHVLGYVSYSEGYRSGGVNIATQDSGPVGNDFPLIYNPDTLASWEVGNKLIFADGIFSAETAVFYNDWVDVQVLVQSDSGFSYISNVGSTEGLGLEWNLTWLPVQPLMLTFSGSYIDTEFTSTSPTKQPGDPVDNVPPLQYSASATWRFNWTAATRGNFRVDYNFVEESVTQTRAPSPSVIESDTLRLLNARLGFELEKLQFYLFGKNLQDQRAAADAQFASLQSRLRPRQIGIELKYAF